MIVILEGLERTGKSTIAEILENNFGFIRFKDHNHLRFMDLKSIANRLDSTLSMLVSLDKAGKNIVLDRFHISELIYGTNDRGYRDYDFDHIYYIDEVLSHLNTKLYLLERDVNNEYVEAFPRKVNESGLLEYQKKFRYAFDKSYIENKCIYNTSEMSFYDVAKDIANFSKRYDFYLASPFFNDDQINREETIKKTLRGYGFRVYAPREHGIVGSLASQEAVASTFNSNVEAINNSRMVLAITDGKDMGTIWEAGYAYGNNIPIVYYAETLGNNPFNIMLSESGVGIFKDYTSFCKACNSNDFYHKEEVAHE
jgi:nucleoside 2-deoxyribosyltransferase/thymidylate kinase